MNKTELVAAIADKAEISKKDSEKALKAFVDVATGETMKIEACKAPKFKAGKALKDAVNE